MALAGYPDYLRYLSSKNEVWVTEPYEGRVEVFSIPTTGTPTPTQAGFVSPGGIPEGLGMDPMRARVYSQTLLGQASSLFVTDADNLAALPSWPVDCQGMHGNPAVDIERGFVFAGCGNAETIVVNESDGTQLDSYTLGPGTALPAYSPELRHFYLRGNPGLPIAILGVGAGGKLTELGKFDSVQKGHCLTVDDHQHVWTCDWQNGALVRYDDPYPATAK